MSCKYLMFDLSIYFCCCEEEKKNKFMSMLETAWNFLS